MNSMFADLIPMTVPSLTQQLSASTPRIPRNRRQNAGPGMLAILRELETSLDASHNAVLRVDLAGMEERTAEQTRLLAQLNALNQPAADAPATGNSHNQNLQNPDLHDQDLPNRDLQSQDVQNQGAHDQDANNADVLAQLHAGAAKVLHLGRVQAALLARARLRTRMIAHLLAGPQAAYAAAARELRQYQYQSAAVPSPRQEDRTPCRA